MKTRRHHIRTIPVRSSLTWASCPDCGRLRTREAIHNRLAHTIADKQVAFLDVTYGEYRTRYSVAGHSAPTRRTLSPGPSTTTPPAGPSSIASSYKSSPKAETVKQVA